MRRKLLVAACALLLSDLVLAHLARWISPFWDPIRTESLYRRPSEVYHHDLRKLVDRDGVWGTARYRVRTNSLGFKDREAREVSLTSSSRRLLLIGDSFTEGVGVEYGDTFAGIMAESLAGEGIEVLNAAVISYSPAIYYSKIRYLIEEVGLEFDEVVVFIDISDIEDEAWFYEVDPDGVVHLREESTPRWARIWNGQLATARWSWPMRLKRILRTRSVFGRLGVLLYDRWTGSGWVPPGQSELLPLTNERRSLWTTQPSYFDGYGRRGLKRAATHMQLLHELLAARSIELTVVVYPWPDQLFHDDLDSIQVSFWKGWCEARGLQFINLFPPFFGEGTAEERMRRYFIANDTHLNETGHELVARHFLGAYRW
jgi:hypothetical protein